MTESSSEIATDRLVIRGLELQSVIGVEDWERRMPQRVFVDIALRGDFSEAAESDDLADAVDYRTVCKRVTEVAASQEYRLVETLADHIARAVLELHPRISDARIGVSKPLALAGFGDARVMVEVTRVR